MSALSVREQAIHVLDGLNEQQLREVIEYAQFLRFRARSRRPTADRAQLAALYAESAEEDRILAEAGMDDYNAQLLAEDRA